MRKFNTIYTIITIFLITSSYLFGEIQISIDSENGENIKTSGFPIYTAKLKVLKDGTQYRLNKSELLIEENTWASSPIEVSDIDSYGWQTVKWYSKERGYYIRTNSSAKFFVTIGNETAKDSGIHLPCNLALLRMIDDDNNIALDYQFGTASPGEKVLKRTRLFAICALQDPQDTSKEIPVKVDSVKTQSNSFTWEWYGSLIDQTPPPVGVVSPFNYNIFLRFIPQNNNYIRDKLTIFYEGGLKEEINLIGNYFPIESNTIMKLIQPNGNEILTPCQQYQIKWKGHNRVYPVIVEYTTDGGFSWNEIVQSRDSSYLWTVPIVQSDFVLVRIRQDFQSSTSHDLELNNIAATKIKFNSNSSRLLSAMQNGKIIEWDVSNYKSTKTYSLGDYNYPTIKIISTGLEYISDDKFVVSYYLSSRSGSRSDSLAFFNVNEDTPYLKIAIDKKDSVKSICIDSKKELLAIIPKISNRVLFYDLVNGNFKNPLSFTSPVSTFAFNPQLSEAVAILTNGQAIHYTLPDLTVKNNYDFSDMPIIAKIAFSPDGKFLAVGCHAPKETQITNTQTQVHVYDIASKQIVRSYLGLDSDPAGMEFNPTSTMLVVGSQTIPQVAFWDLVTDKYVGNLDANNLKIVDLQFAPDGRTIASISQNPDALQIKTFIYPEADKSDNYLKIVQPSVKLETAKFSPNYISNDVEQVFETVLCNDGIVPVVLSNSWWNQNRNFHLQTQLFPVTLAPNECLHIPLVFNPIDTGAVVDSLYIGYCSGNYALPVTGTGLNRNITFFKENLNFGELCVGSSIEKEITVAKNNDPVPLKVNLAAFFDNSSFSVIDSPVDTILAPGGILTLKIRFNPTTFGDISSNLTIQHSNLEKFQVSTPAIGYGLGTQLNLSHQNLMFIPEILERKVTITNSSNNEIVINGVTFEPEGIFSINSGLPLTIPALASADINVLWNGETFDNVKLSFEVLPCLSQNYVAIAIYKGNSTLSVPNVSADPREETSIKVEYSNSENKPYNGTRFFEGAVSLNPRIFFPTAISSEYGAAQIISNTIQNDRRIISFRVEGDFPRSGVLAEIKGFAALAEIDTSIITVPDNFPHWGSTILTSSKNGLFQLINLCGARRISQNSNKIAILSIAPNPVKEYFKLEFETTMKDNSIIEIYDGLGNLIYKNELQIVKSGKNEIDINAASLLSGNYKLIVRQGTEIAVSSFAIIR